MTNNNDARKYDVTIYGATGSVGKYVCEYFRDVVIKEQATAPTLQNNKPILTICLAGRNKSKLIQLKNKLLINDKLLLEIDIFVADSSDRKALDEMTNQSKIIVNCAGPFAKYGEHVVASCVESNTHYLDITGEVHWVAAMRQTYGNKKKNNSARIISLCGYDSVPSDLSILYAIQMIKQQQQQQQLSSSSQTEKDKNKENDDDESLEILEGVTLHYIKGAVNGGTIQSFVNMPLDIKQMFWDEVNHSIRKVPLFMWDPLCLTHPTLVRHNPDFDNQRNQMAWNEWKNQLPSVDGQLALFPTTSSTTSIASILWSFISWMYCCGSSASHFMSPVNSKVVYASSIALNYGPNFYYRERIVPLGFKATRMLGIFSLAVSLWFSSIIIILGSILKLGFIGRFLANMLFPAGFVVSKEFNEKCHVHVYAEVKGKKKRKISKTDEKEEEEYYRAACRVEFEGDPGNIVTAQCICEAALALLWNKDDLPEPSQDGFGTPAQLLGTTLMERLQNSKVRPVKVSTGVCCEAKTADGCSNGGDFKNNKSSNWTVPPRGFLC